MLKWNDLGNWENWEDLFLQAYDNKEKIDSRVLSELAYEAEFEISRDKHRWFELVESVIKVKDRYFLIEWKDALTEMQESYWDKQPVEVKKVEKEVTKVVTVWEEI